MTKPTKRFPYYIKTNIHGLVHFFFLLRETNRAVTGMSIRCNNYYILQLFMTS